MQALLTDTHLRSVLAGIRGLGRAGHDVHAIGPHLGAGGLWSRYTTSRTVAPAGDRPALVARMEQLSARHGPLIAYPGQESTIDMLLAGPMPAGVELPYPNIRALALLRDKRRLPDLAGDVGLASPRTLIEASAEELRGWSPPAPCVLKPAHPGGALPTAVIADSAAQLRTIVSGLPARELLLVQERAGGRLTALALVVDRSGVATASFQQVSRRTWPSDAGISTLAESVKLDEGLAARGTKLLAAAGFAGLVQLQFLEVSGVPALIDVNPRFYGSLPLALACGVNLPAAWHATATGRTGPAQPLGYRTGVLFHWLEGEMLLAARASARPRSGVTRAMLSRPRRPRVGAVWAVDDPVAGAAFGAGWAVGVAARRLRG